MQRKKKLHKKNSDEMFLLLRIKCGIKKIVFLLCYIKCQTLTIIFCGDLHADCRVTMGREWTYLEYANKIIYTYSLRDLAKEFLILLYKMDWINFNFISANMYFNIPGKK